MRRSRILIILTILFVTQAAFSSQDGKTSKTADAAEESAKAAKTLEEIMGIPEKAIPESVLDSAECVAVFPSTIKGGFIVGAQKGEGVVSCRAPGGWSAPVFLDMTGGSIGAQIGVQSTDYVLLFMNTKGADHLLKNELEPKHP